MQASALKFFCINNNFIWKISKKQPYYNWDFLFKVTGSLKKTLQHNIFFKLGKNRIYKSYNLCHKSLQSILSKYTSSNSTSV